MEVTITRLRKIPPRAQYQDEIDALNAACFEDIFGFLGPHCVDERMQIRLFLPGAESVIVTTTDTDFIAQRINDSDLFIADMPNHNDQKDYRLKVCYPLTTIVIEDPYRFNSLLDEDFCFLFNQGKQSQAYRHLGGHFDEVDGIHGARFSLWAPNAKSVSLISDDNHWNPSRHIMRKHPVSGIWDIFIPELTSGVRYKYHIVAMTGERIEKADPYANFMQNPPDTASILHHCMPHRMPKSWQDKRNTRNAVDAPISIYEVHLGSWKRQGDDGKAFLSYQQLAEQLVPYVSDLGFTHVQFMPISEFPFNGSWGYQPVGMFAPTSRFGTPEDFAYLVAQFQQAGIGVLIDWVPGHFPSDPHGLARFDGTHLFEHADKRQGFHPDWNTLIYNYGREEVRSYLHSSANVWFQQYGVDGLRVDAVASMLYLDYSREEGEWIANEHGGRENLDAISLIQQINQDCYRDNPGIMMVAEESTAWPGVTGFVDGGGLGFGFKWNMGWMNDSLQYMHRDPLYRSHYHGEMTFSMVYAFSENYILPLSHDEVVHGKGSLLNKMPGDDWQKFANLRAYYGFMWGHPGKKLLFMGGEFGQWKEWDHDHSLDWHLLQYEPHQGLQNLIRDLNYTYVSQPALYQYDNNPLGFDWVDEGNAEQSIFSFIRYNKERTCGVLILANMTPATYQCYRIGVPSAGRYHQLINTDNARYGGSGVGLADYVETEAEQCHGQTQSIMTDIPPLATMMFAFKVQP